MHWRRFIMGGTELAENFVDDFISKIRKKLKWNSPVILMPYRSYGTVEKIYVIGRVLQNKLIEPSEDKGKLLHNLLDMYKRFQSDEVPDVKIAIHYQDVQREVISDDEGYFQLQFYSPTTRQTDRIWHLVSLKIVQSPIPWDKEENHAEVLIPPVDAEFGVISDIDDTVIKTSATKVLAMAKTVFLHNAHSRLPFAGVSAFYKALLLGKNGKRNNPFFYVSSSPWNMYDLLKEFLDLNEIPAGPLLLRDFGWKENKFVNSGHQSHKTKEIEQILDMYPNLNFILIGDSGQQDIYIYTDIALAHPGRILAIYIRDLGLIRKQKAIRDQIIKAETLGISITLTKDAEEASRHAADRGFIFQSTIPEISIDKKKDKGELPGKEELEVL